MSRNLIATVLLGVALSACATSGTTVVIPDYSCVRVPSGACQEQADGLAAAADGPVRAIEVTCLGANCTRAGGAGHATITLVDGTTFGRTWTYAGDPNPPPEPVCLGLPQDICLQRVQNLIPSVSPSHHLTSVTVTCIQTCDARGGDVVVVFKSEGGVEDSMRTNWGGP